MKKEERFRKVLRSVNNYLVFFVFIGFVITCCTMLFVTVLSQTMGLEFTAENIGTAAKLTFGNVVLLSLICTAVDAVRRHFTVYLPAKQITDAAQKLMEGDFSVRVRPIRNVFTDDKFNEIIDCFNRMAQELSGTETLRTDFIANVSHELKTPLAVMRNYAAMLKRPGLPEKERVEYAQAVADASRRLADLISNILKLNKLENQQILPVAKPYDLTEQLCGCLLDFEDLWEKKQLEVETQLEENVVVSADAELLSIVWNNLFSNAIKFTEPGGRIGLWLYTRDGTAVVQVKDTGCGISREVGARMFDKFYQGDTSHSAQGNGLGLALVKRIIDMTGSDISVESELGKGTVFTVRLRRAANGEIQKDMR